MSKFRSMIVREEVWLIFLGLPIWPFPQTGQGEEKKSGGDRDTILGDLFEAF